MTMTKPITIDTTKREHEQREAFQGALSQMGITLPSKSFDRAFARIRQIAGDDGKIPGDRLQSIMDDVVSGMEVFQGVADSYR
jgi:isopropylmalate/homocitrate/citramalate synthase